MKRLLDVADVPIIVLTAPAGYGKTTTIALWDDADERAFAWVHLDALDDDPVHLLRHVGLALDEHWPLDPTTVRMLAGRGRPVDTDLLVAMGSELRRRPSFVLVLDDVHAVTSAASHRVIEGLLRNIASDSQLVLSGRAVPPLPLARQRMSAEVFEVSTGDLAMSATEAAELLERGGADLDDSAVARLIEETEGWPGGLHLAALAARGPTIRGTEGLFGSNRAVADYLVEEVLDALEPEMVDFLMRSSVLTRMSASLLDRLLDACSSGRRLDEIERSGNMFLLPLDDQREWFRYHHLFGEMLRARLRAVDPAEATRLERRASRLLEADHDIDGSIRHAIAGDERDRAADLTLRHAFRSVFGGGVDRLGLWLDLLGPDSVENIASAALASAWYGVATGDADLVWRGLTNAERLPASVPLADGSPTMEVGIAIVRSVVGPWGLEGVLRDTELVRAAGRDGSPWWGLATAVQGSVCTMLGDLDRARRNLLDGLPMVTSPVFEAAGLAHLALLDLHEGDVRQADRRSTRALAVVDRFRLEAVLPSAVTFAVASLVAARNGRNDESRQHTTRARRLLARFGELAPRSALIGYLLLAQAAVAVGDLSLARGLAVEARRAQRSETEATFLNAQLDDLVEQLDRGSHDGTLDITPLTPAELRVLAYLPTHYSLQEIADELFISRNTAKSHSVAIYRKLSVSSRTDAVEHARSLGILEQ